MKWTFILFWFAAGAIHAQDAEAPDERELRNSIDLTWEANKELSEDNFVEAEADYRRAISKSGQNTAAPYNLGNAYYQNQNFSEAFGRYKQAGELAQDKAKKQKAYHNMGNVFMKNKDYAKAVEAYKEALRNDPADEETRYNLALAKEMMKKQQDQQQNDDKGGDNKEDQKDQGDNQDENQGAQEDNQEENKSEEGDEEDGQKQQDKEGDGEEKEKKDKQPGKGEEPEKQQRPRPNQLSPQQVENLLEAMQNEEKKVQEKMDARKVKGVKQKKEKDW